MPSPLFGRHLSESLFRLRRNQLLVVLMTFAAVMIFTGIGLRSPWPADEPRFAEVAREMVASGQWLIPMRGGEFYPDKPPVFMWSIALFYWLTGNLKVAFLLPSAICGLLTLGLIFDLGTRLWNQRVGTIAVLLLMIAPQFLLQARTAQIDAMVACWITVACYGLIRHFFTGPAWGWYIVAWGFTGLGIITKGVGFLPVFLFIPILLIALRDRRLFSDTLTWCCAIGPLVMILVAALWLAPMVLYVNNLGTEDALAYKNNILFKQTGERYASPGGHIRPWHYYLANVIPSLWFPLPLLLLALFRPVKEVIRHRPVVLVLLVWVALVVIFFSISPGKRGVYLLPALPMFALSLAPVFSTYPSARWFPLVLTIIHFLLAIVLITTGVMAWSNHPGLVEKVSNYSQNPANLHKAGTLVFTIGLVWLLGLAIFWRADALVRFFLAMMISWLLYTTWGYNILEPLRTPRTVLATAEQSVPPHAQLGMIDFKEQFILFSRLDFTHFSYFSNRQQEERNAWLWMSQTADSYLIVEDLHDFQCFTRNGGTFLGTAHRKDYRLLSDEQLMVSCKPPDQVKWFTTPTPGMWQDD